MQARRDEVKTQCLTDAVRAQAATTASAAIRSHSTICFCVDVKPKFVC